MTARPVCTARPFRRRDERPLGALVSNSRWCVQLRTQSADLRRVTTTTASAPVPPALLQHRRRRADTPRSRRAGLRLTDLLPAHRTGRGTTPACASCRSARPPCSASAGRLQAVRAAVVFHVSSFASWHLFLDFARHWLVWRRAAGSCPLSSARTAGARRAGIAADAAASVLLMPRSLVVFAGAAYTEHLHGIDEVRLPRERSFMVCEQKCMPQCLYGVAGCISCRPAWRHTPGTVKRRCSAARMHAGLVALRI